MPIIFCPSFFTPVVLTVLLVCSASAAAEKADQNKPMNIEADNLRYQDGTKASLFQGNVVVVKGSISMRGERLEVKQDAAGNQLAQLQGSAGHEALFRQKRDGLNEYIEATASNITYDSKTATVKLQGGAVLRRLRGGVKVDEISGAHIVYNSNTDIFSVDGGAAQNAPGVGGRVRVTLTTGKNASMGTGDDVPPAKDAPAPSVLKPSLELKGSLDGKKGAASNALDEGR